MRRSSPDSTIGVPLDVRFDLRRHDLGEKSAKVSDRIKRIGTTHEASSIVD
jgi:hypothetical protein